MIRSARYEDWIICHKIHFCILEIKYGIWKYSQIKDCNISIFKTFQTFVSVLVTILYLSRVGKFRKNNFKTEFCLFYSRNWGIATNSKCLILISLQPNGVKLNISNLD